MARVCPHVTVERVAGRGHLRIVHDQAVIRQALGFLAELASGSAAP